MTWQAARSGLPTDTAAVNESAQVNQFLAAHGITPVYTGAALVSPSGLVGYGYGSPVTVSLDTYDVDQPFTQPAGHTAIGRVTLPLIPNGTGADVTVSLCADSSGAPGTVITSVTIPAEHLACLSSGPLATAASIQIVPGDMTAAAWQSPVSGAGATTWASSATSGNYIVSAGGQAPTGSTYTNQVLTTAWAGGAAPGSVMPQASLPAAAANGTLIATADVLVFAGGMGTSSSVPLSTVYAAGWSPASGQVQAWTAQTALPTNLWQASGAFDPNTDTVYIIGGQTTSLTSGTVAAVWRATVTNGQVGAWTACPPLPVARANMYTGLVNGWLIAAGGNDTTGTTSPLSWCAKVNSDGSLGLWQAIEAMPYTSGNVVAGNGSCVIPGSGLMVFGGTSSSTPYVYQAASLAVTADGPGSWLGWQLLSTSQVGEAAANSLLGVFTSTSGWEALVIGPTNGVYAAGPLTQVPAVSVPLPATGLTGGSTYHLLVHQQGGNVADCVSLLAGAGAQATSAQTRPAGGGSWTTMSGHLYSLYATVYDQTVGGQAVHLWEDSGARFTTLLYGAATGQLLGVLEATAFPSGSPKPMLAAVTQVQYESGQPSGLLQLA